jgi:hypothetical protein
MAWWIPELVRAGVLLSGGILVQQLIRRHGVGYAAEVFKATPRAGAGFCALADIAYYLIVVAYTLFNVRLEGHQSEATLAEWQDVIASIGGLALIIGGLHAFNVFILPSVGNILARQVSTRNRGKTPRIRTQP